MRRRATSKASGLLLMAMVGCGWSSPPPDLGPRFTYLGEPHSRPIGGNSAMMITGVAHQGRIWLPSSLGEVQTLAWFSPSTGVGEILPGGPKTAP